MSGLRILEPGLLSTVQDLGRRGFQRFGVPAAGALDPEGLRLANALVRGGAGQAAIEMRWLGPAFEVEADRVRVAVAGAAIAGTLTRDGETSPFEADRSHLLRRGDRVKIGALRGGSTAYLAVEGGVDAPVTLGARATFLRARIGGLDGRALAAGDMVPAAEATDGPDLAFAAPPDLSPPARIRVGPGPQEDHFTDAARATFLEAEWTVSKDADRMGLRLEGPKLEHAHGHDITSDGIALGAIQVPGAGRPIVLLADRQTSGGYPKIGCVISADLPALGRLGPGAKLRFEAVSAAEGVRIARAREAELRRILEGVGPHRPAGALDLDALYSANLISGAVAD